MQEDFHYYATAVLARAAGFPAQEALTIAYAAQYVDDSTESEPFLVGGRMFEPVRTAHAGLGVFDWSVQKRIYMPFHFLPADPTCAPSGNFETQPDSPFARKLLQQAASEPPGLLSLCRIGVAAHTYADTWAHSGFCGREDPVNDVESIYLNKNGEWNHLFLENIFLDLLPRVGHGQAGTYPDVPSQLWKYKRGSTGQVMPRDNATLFESAAKAIYDWLNGLPKAASAPVVSWDKIKTDFGALLRSQGSLGERCKAWRSRFGTMLDGQAFEYSKLKWRQEALGAEQRHGAAGTDWDSFDPSELARLSFAGSPQFRESPWVQFHRAALRQRHFVLESMM